MAVVGFQADGSALAKRVKQRLEVSDDARSFPDAWDYAGKVVGAVRGSSAGWGAAGQVDEVCCWAWTAAMAEQQQGGSWSSFAASQELRLLAHSVVGWARSTSMA